MLHDSVIGRFAEGSRLGVSWAITVRQRLKRAGLAPYIQIEDPQDGNSWLVVSDVLWLPHMLASTQMHAQIR